VSATSSRRRFIGATSLALSAPLAGLGASVAGAAATSDPLPDHVGEIRALMHGHAKRLSASPDGFGSLDRIDVGADGRTATATLHCLVEAETAIGPDCPIVDMARQQGGGVVRHIEHGVFDAVLSKRDGAWTIERISFRATQFPP
jgi:hypothetical protein